MNKKYDRFEFEQEIMKAWGLVDDISEVAKALGKNTSKAEAIKMLEGLALLYAGRFEKVFDHFEKSIEIIDTGKDSDSK